MSAPSIADLIAHPERVAGLLQAERDHLLRQLAALVLVLTNTPPNSSTEGSNGDGDSLLTVQEVADLVRQDRSWVWRRARRADWRGFVVKPSRKVLLVRRAGLEQWLAKRAECR